MGCICNDEVVDGSDAFVCIDVSKDRASEMKSFVPGGNCCCFSVRMTEVELLI